jgi:hypothetical protein
MALGRPVRSQVRENIIEILYFKTSLCGYDISKIYMDIFPNVTMRNIYYHLKKGVSLKEIEVAEIKRVQGNYSWGPEAEKIYYKLGPNANPKADIRVKRYFDKLNKIKN